MLGPGQPVGPVDQVGGHPRPLDPPHTLLEEGVPEEHEVPLLAASPVLLDPGINTKLTERGI